MACVTKPVFKPSVMANRCLISVPPVFTIRTISSYHSLTIPSSYRPIKLQLSHSASSFSLRKNRTRHPSSSLVAFSLENELLDATAVAEDDTVEEKDWSSAEVDEEEGVIEAVGDAGESAEEDGFSQEEYSEPPEEAKLFVGNLPYNVDSEQLAHLFNQAGVVEIAEVIYNRDTDQSRGFGFVTMSNTVEAEKAVEMFDRFDVNGRLLTVNKAAAKGSRPERPPRVFEPASRIYVGNLPWDVDDARLEQVFSEHGKVVNARVVYDRESGRSRGFGFVTMSTEAELNDAIANLDGLSLSGRSIRVNVAEDRPRRGGF